MDNSSKAESIVLEYKAKSEKILDAMLGVIIRAGRKADNVHYQRILDQVNKEINSK
jgi:hypothetical protein